MNDEPDAFWSMLAIIVLVIAILLMAIHQKVYSRDPSRISPHAQDIRQGSRIYNQGAK